MNACEYGSLYRFESFYWWYTARRKLIAEFIRDHWKTESAKTRILDVGCGTGINCCMLSEFGEVHGVDMSEAALIFSRKRGVQNLQLASVEHLTFKANSFQLLTALDILEHTDDDIAVLAELYRVTSPGGKLVLTVPAYGFLWSEHDEALHHRRRYTSAELRNKLVLAGFEIERCSYFISFLFFPILLMRTLQNLRKSSVQPKTSHVLLPKWLNNLLIKVLDVERLLLRAINLPLGVSIVCVAQKPEQAWAKDENEVEQDGYADLAEVPAIVV